jgi:hypothetical protein
MFAVQAVQIDGKVTIGVIFAVSLLTFWPITRWLLLSRIT